MYMNIPGETFQEYNRSRRKTIFRRIKDVSSLSTQLRVRLSLHSFVDELGQNTYLTLWHHPHVGNPKYHLRWKQLFSLLHSSSINWLSRIDMTGTLLASILILISLPATRPFVFWAQRHDHCHTAGKVKVSKFCVSRHKFESACIKDPELAVAIDLAERECSSHTHSGHKGKRK